MDLSARNDVIREYLRRLAEISPWERDHAERVAVHAVATGNHLGVPARELSAIRYAATLHRVGLLASGDLMGGNLHYASEGAAILRKTPFLRAAAKIVAAHRERFDGSGGPLGIAGEAVSLAARIVGTCDSYDVLAYGGPEEQPHPAPWGELNKPGFDLRVVEALQAMAPLIQPLGT